VNDSVRRDFDAYVRARSHRLFRTAMALTGHRHDAEDLVQTVLARSLRHWSSIRRDPDAYVLRAMYRQRASWWRRPGRRREVLGAPAPDAASPDAAAGVDNRLTLVEALRRLPTRQRAVLVLTYLEDQPDEAIAETLAITTATVRSQRSRALDKLRNLAIASEELRHEHQSRP
jgi:RNA polymerase sigma-70 factor (sigma-E family)